MWFDIRERARTEASESYPYASHSEGGFVMDDVKVLC